MANDIPISERELEILRLVATGASNQQIAQQLSISINTVKVHLRNIFSKIGVVSRTEATLYAINNGLLAVDPDAAPAIIAQRRAEEFAAGELLDAPVAALALARPEPTLAPPAALPRPPARRATRVLIGAAAGLALLIALALGAQVAGRPPAPAATQAPAVSPAAADDASQRWFAYAPLPTPRDGFALASYDQEHKLYVIGGRSGDAPSAAIDRFDPASDRWVSLTEKPTATSDAGAIALRGSIYVPGGLDASGKVRDILEIYDPREQRWSSGPAMPAARSRYALVAWEGRLYLIGGWDGAQVRSEVYIYDPERNSWSEGPALASPRQSAGATVAAGRIYVIGGSDASGPLRQSARLDPTAENARWEGIAPLPDAVAAPAVAAPVGLILVFDPAQRQGLQYDQGTDSWTRFAIPAGATIAPSVALLGGSLYFVSDTAAPTPGQVGEYRVLFTIFVPGASGTVPKP